MSIKEKVEKSHVYKAQIDYIQDNTPLLLRGFYFKQLEGRLLTILEMMGVSEKQESAVRGYIAQAIWGNLDDGYVVIISEEENRKITEPIFSGSSKS